MNAFNKLNKAAVIGVLAVIVVVIAVVVATNRVNKPSSTADLSKPASLALTSVFGETASVGDLQHIRWTSVNYGAPTVSVNIIRKIGDNPTRYELVRQVATATKNDGDAVWVPAITDAGTGMYVEVGCTFSDQACTATPLASSPLAVVNDGRYANTAAAYQAIEAEYNN